MIVGRLAYIAIILGLSFSGCNKKNEQTQTEAEQKPPNFILIFTDDQGYGDLGCYGSPNIATPNIDRMAAEGMKFTSFYAQTVCGPSRSSLMTGCYPLRVARKNRQEEHHPNMSVDEVTIAELLKEVGYKTACFGKWDLAGHSQKKYDTTSLPTRQGFDYFYGTPTSNDSYVDLLRNEELIEENADLKTLTAKYTQEVIHFISKNRKEPFFIYLPHTMPHIRLGASEKFKGKSERGLYGDVIEEIDWSTGQIFAALNSLGLDENTYVIYTSDNGPWWLGGHPRLSLQRDEGGWHGGSAGSLRGYKCTTWEGGLRVPAIVWGPKVKANAISHEVTATIDILPTLAHLAGATVPEDRIIDGKDISKLFIDPDANLYPDRPYYYYAHDRLQAIRKGKWKLHLAYNETYPKEWEVFIKEEDRVDFDNPVLFDLNADIGEKKDLAHQFPDVVRELLRYAEIGRNDIGDFDRKGTGARFFTTQNAKQDN